VPCMSVSPEERKEIFEKAWNWETGCWYYVLEHHFFDMLTRFPTDGGGIFFQLGTFSDIIISPEANEEAAQFIRDKIKTIVKDPKTAELLTPHDLYARRPLCDDGYFYQFNRPNVHLVVGFART